MKDDTIKRSDAIKALRKLGHEVVVVDKVCSLGVATEFIDVIRTVPSADRPQGWIPCSERLPNQERATYLICTDDGYICSCRWTNVNPFLTDLTVEWHWCEFDIPQYNKAVAWMDLKPWKGAGDE